MKKYENYKTASTEWFGQIPFHWDTTSFKNLIQKNDGGVWGDDAEEGEGNIVLRSTEINLDGTWNLEAPAYRKLSADEIQKAALKAGDLLVTKSSGSELHIGKTALVDEKLEALVCCYSNFTQRIRITDLNDSKFFFYYLNCPIARTQYNLLSKSAIGLANLSGTLLGNLVVPKIPLPEQRAIAAYLDRKTAQLDTLLAQKEALLQKLHQKRQALINEAVTQGLDPAAPRKPSGVAWLGDVPAHWEVKKLKHLCAIQGRIGFKGYTKEDLVEADKGALTIGAKHIKDDLLNLSSPEYISWEKYYESPEIAVSVNDIVFTQRGSLGKVAIINNEIGPATINPSMVLLKQINCNSKFLYYFLTSGFIQARVNLVRSATAVPMISQAQLSEFEIMRPPTADQESIVKFIDHKTAQINEAAAAIHTQIQTLKAYRQSLISEVVTGKVDVRPAVPATEADLPLWRQ